MKLGLLKTIRSKLGKLHFKRWGFECSWFALYLHYIARSDEDRHAHNHPWNFYSFIIWGGYIEEVSTPNDLYGNFDYKIVKRSIGSIAYRTINQFHKLTLIRPTWTLVLTGPRKIEWGYKTESGFIDHITYRQLKDLNQL